MHRRCGACSQCSGTAPGNAAASNSVVTARPRQLPTGLRYLLPYCALLTSESPANRGPFGRMIKHSSRFRCMAAAIEVRDAVGTMTTLDSPEKILFTSTTQAFLEGSAVAAGPGAARRGYVVRPGVVAARRRARLDRSARPGGVGRRKRLGERLRRSGDGRRTTGKDGGAGAAVSGQHRAGRAGGVREFRGACRPDRGADLG